MLLELSRPQIPLQGVIRLDGSKSISNRVLILRALSKKDFPIQHISTSKDVSTMQELLALDPASDTLYDAGAAGTTFRFMTAFLSLQKGTQTLTGTPRMLQRPVGVLVEALRALGAKIDYLGKEGYPPLQIHPPGDLTAKNFLQIAAGTSSQYITALLLIAPILPNGLRLQLDGRVVSRPYIEMTLSLLRYFGVQSTWIDDQIHIAPQTIEARPFTVEADWSAASYYYSMAALSSDTDLELHGLFSDSLQGDSVLSEMFPKLGVETTFTSNGIRLRRSGNPMPGRFVWDFLKCPDLAQTLAVTCGALGVEAEFSGLGTLRIKETDRIAALEVELEKVNVEAQGLGDEAMTINGKANWDAAPSFATYEDHRMAMAFAPLAMLQPVRIQEPMVVVKSYPAFWEDLSRLDFAVKTLD